MLKIKFERTFKMGIYSIYKVIDRFGSWKYSLFKNNEWQESSHNFEGLKQKALGGF